MNDFLGRLLARSRSTAADIRPRLPGWYESVRPARGAAVAGPGPRAVDGVPDDAHADGAGAFVARQPQARPDSPEPASPHRGRLHVTEQAAVGDDDGESVARPVRPGGPGVVHRARASAPLDSLRVVMHPLVDDAPLPPRLPGEAPVTPLRSPLDVPVRVRGMDEPGEAMDLARHSGETANETEVPRRASAGRERAITPSPVTPAPPGPARDVVRIEERAREESPAIRIHIGRIDVRAVHEAPAEAPAPRPQLKRLTLEEYARERERGQR